LKPSDAQQGCSRCGWFADATTERSTRQQAAEATTTTTRRTLSRRSSTTSVIPSSLNKQDQRMEHTVVDYAYSSMLLIDQQPTGKMRPFQSHCSFVCFININLQCVCIRYGSFRSQDRRAWLFTPNDRAGRLSSCRSLSLVTRARQRSRPRSPPSPSSASPATTRDCSRRSAS
jgi:hypothetical protein